MKKIVYFLAFSLLIFACKPEPIALPDPVLNPPNWFIGQWNHYDSTGVLEKLTVSETNLIIDNFNNNASINYTNFFKENDVYFTEKLNHNISYGFEYSENNEVKLVNFGIIGDRKIRFINENGPTLKTYVKE